MLQRNKIIQFEPSFKKFNEVLLRLFDEMITAVSYFPRLETTLYIDLQGRPDVLKVSIIVSLKRTDQQDTVDQLVLIYGEHK